jgi:serine/threonine protein kinase
MTQLEPGLEFLPHLTLVRRLGRGGMGEAWVARDVSRGEEVVAKILSGGAPEERVALLRREARLVRKVQHPGIVPVYGFEQGPHGSAVVSRYMKGGDAGRLRGGEPRAIVRLGREVAEALGHLHGLGVVHRDVKPTNVLLDESGRAHLADFGIAAVAHPHDDEGLILHGGGSRASMSPQQRAGAAAEPADDVYALGALLHELLSGRPPFPATATDEVVRTVPAPSLSAPVPGSLRALVASMLAKTVEGRPHMVAVEEALRHIEEELAPTAPPVSRPPDVRLQPPPRVREVGVSAPPARPSTPVPPPPPSRPARSLPLSQVALIGVLAVAVLFVVLVLPRLADRPTSTADPGSEAAPPALAEATAMPAAAPEPEALPPSRPEAPPARGGHSPLPAEATPTAGPAPRERMPTASEARPSAKPSRDPAPDQAGRRAQEEFAAAMSEAQAASDRGDWPAARQGLARAAALQPGSPAVADARRRIEEADRTAALARQREVARGYEAQEDWRRALAEYEAALKLDPTVAFALEGQERSATRAALAEKLDFHIGHPLRLATDAVAREAEVLLQQAREIDSPGPRHRRRVAALESALVEVRTPVAVVLESDGETQVVVHKVGRLGAFERKTLDLKPGTYTVIGTRSGYRDVRRQLVVKPAAAPPPLQVRCEEAI